LVVTGSVVRLIIQAIACGGDGRIPHQTGYCIQLVVSVVNEEQKATGVGMKVSTNVGVIVGKSNSTRKPVYLEKAFPNWPNPTSPWSFRT